VKRSLATAAACVAAAACYDFDRALTVCMANGGCAGSADGGGGRDGGAVVKLVVALDAGAVVDLPVLVTLGRSETSRVVNPATDLSFVDDASGRTLPFEVARWDAGEGDVWVRLPDLDGTATLTLTTGPNVGAADAGAVWSGWELVHHFEAGLRSSVDGRYAAGRVGGTTRPGVVGDAPYFSGSGDQRVGFAGGEALFDGWSRFTLAFWLYADYPSAAAITGEPGFLDKGGGLNLGRLVGSSRFQVDTHFTSGDNAYLGGSVALRRWMFIVYTFDGSTVVVYVDGVEENRHVLAGGPSQLVSSNFAFFLGDRNGPLTGSIDELWIEKSARDEAWITAVNRSVRRQVVTIR